MGAGGTRALVRNCVVLFCGLVAEPQYNPFSFFVFFADNPPMTAAGDQQESQKRFALEGSFSPFLFVIVLCCSVV